MWRDFEPWAKCLTYESRTSIEQAAIANYANGAKTFYEIKVGAFLDYLDGDISAVGVKGDASVFEHYYIEGLATFTAEFVKMLQRLTLERTGDEIAASSNLVQMTFAESTLVFLRAYFGLPNFKAAAELTLNDWLIAKHDAYNTQLFQRNFNELQKRKIKTKK